MIDELTKFYEEKGILSTKFNCPFLSDCSYGNPSNLIKGKAAYIGKYYEDHKLPRILFLSLDMGSDKDYETELNRTPEGVREIEENRNWTSLEKNLHWFETHDFAQKIAQTMGFIYQSNEINHIFAHTNSAKCCENKKNNDMSNNTLYRNCRRFIGNEIEILNPDILISQGGRAANALKYNFQDMASETTFTNIHQIHERTRILIINKHPVLFLRTNYPTGRYGISTSQKENLYPYYLKAVKVFSDKYLINQQ